MVRGGCQNGCSSILVRVTEYFRDRHTFYLRVYVCVDVRGVDVCVSLTWPYINKASCPCHYKRRSWVDFDGGRKCKHSTGVSPRLFVDAVGLVLSSRSMAPVI